MSHRGQRTRMYYDGQCGLCRAGVRRLLRLDWLGRLEAVDYTQLQPAQRPVEEDAFARGMPLHTSDGRLLLGFPAVRYALRQTPVGWLVGWLLYIPGVSHLARWSYDAFALRRPRRGGASTACRL